MIVCDGIVVHRKKMATEAQVEKTEIHAESVNVTVIVTKNAGDDATKNASTNDPGTNMTIYTTIKVAEMRKADPQETITEIRESTKKKISERRITGVLTR